MKDLRGHLALAVMLASSVCAAAGGYPDKPIRMIVPVPAGGTPDVVARMVTPGLSSALGQQFVVDNRGGAGGSSAPSLRRAPHPTAIRCSSPAPGRSRYCRIAEEDRLRPAARFRAHRSHLGGPFLLITHPSVPRNRCRSDRARQGSPES